jgi:alpha-amylase
MTGDGVVDIDAQGWGTFTCFANEVQVWIKLPEDATVASSREPS